MKSLKKYITESKTKNETYHIKDFIIQPSAQDDIDDNVIISRLPIKSLTQIKGFAELTDDDIQQTNLNVSIGHVPIQNLNGCCEKVYTITLHDLPKFKSFEGTLKQAQYINLEDTHLLNYKGLSTIKPFLMPEFTTFTHTNKVPQTGNFDFTELNHLKGSIMFTGLGFKELTNMHVNLKGTFSIADVPNYKSAHNIWTHVQSVSQLIFSRKVHIETHLLGILRIKNLEKFILISDSNTNKIYQIIAKYIPLKSMSDIMRCKQELTNAGFKEAAQF